MTPHNFPIGGQRRLKIFSLMETHRANIRAKFHVPEFKEDGGRNSVSNMNLLSAPQTSGMISPGNAGV